MEQISLEDFNIQMKPIVEEMDVINKRSRELHDAFKKLANSVEVDENDDDAMEEFKDTMFENAGMFIDNIDYDYSEVEPGSVNIWQSSTC